MSLGWRFEETRRHLTIAGGKLGTNLTYLPPTYMYLKAYHIAPSETVAVYRPCESSTAGKRRQIPMTGYVASGYFNFQGHLKQLSQPFQGAYCKEIQRLTLRHNSRSDFFCTRAPGSKIKDPRRMKARADIIRRPRQSLETFSYESGVVKGHFTEHELVSSLSICDRKEFRNVPATRPSLSRDL